MPLNYFLCHAVILNSTFCPVVVLTSSSALSVHLSGYVPSQIGWEKWEECPCCLL